MGDEELSVEELKFKLASAEELAAKAAMRVGRARRGRVGAHSYCLSAPGQRGGEAMFTAP